MAAAISTKVVTVNTKEEGQSQRDMHKGCDYCGSLRVHWGHRVQYSGRAQNKPKICCPLESVLAKVCVLTCGWDLWQEIS